MELCYRGIHYQSNPSSVPISGKRNVVRFRGCSYELNHAVINVPQTSKGEVVYRGVSMTSGNKIKFMGRFCEYNKVVLTPSYCLI